MQSFQNEQKSGNWNSLTKTGHIVSHYYGMSAVTYDTMSQPQQLFMTSILMEGAVDAC